MAKVSFNKLGLKKNSEIINVEYNGIDIEVSKYLPISNKLDLITKVAIDAHDDNNFSNPIKFKIHITLAIIEAYTNITFTEKQKEDPYKLYDILYSTGFVDIIFNTIPEKELKILFEDAYKCIEAIYTYRSSIMGILDILKEDYSSLNFDASAIQEKLADPENMTLLKSVLEQLG